MALPSFIWFICFLAVAAATDDETKGEKTCEPTVIVDPPFYAYGPYAIDDFCQITRDDEKIRCAPYKWKSLTTQTRTEYGNRYFKKAAFDDLVIPVMKRSKLFRHRELGELQELSFLNTSTTEIEPGMFDDLESLKQLVIGQNLLATLDEKVFTKKLGATLTHLELGFNKFTDISWVIFENLPNLKYLGLGGNELVSFGSIQFPESLEKLEFLSLGQCNIQILNDDNFANLKSLHTLHLGMNPLTTIPKAINAIPNLSTLYMSNTSISTLHRDENVAHGTLAQLYFDDMPLLTSVEDCAFCNFPNLNVTSFSESKKLTAIDRNAFGAFEFHGPIEIKEFGIQNCNVSTLPQTLLNWNKLEKLYIDQNRFACDCDMEWFINDLNSSRGKLYKKFQIYMGSQWPWGREEQLYLPTCAYPDAFAGQKMFNISASYCTE